MSDRLDQLMMDYTLDRAKVAMGRCPFCGLDTEELFRDDASAEEFKKNGICQFCQDEFLNEHRTMTYRVDGRHVHVKDGRVVGVEPSDVVRHIWIGKSFTELRANGGHEITL